MENLSLNQNGKNFHCSKKSKQLEKNDIIFLSFQWKLWFLHNYFSFSNIIVFFINFKVKKSFSFKNEHFGHFASICINLWNHIKNIFMHSPYRNIEKYIFEFSCAIDTFNIFLFVRYFHITLWLIFWVCL